MSFCAVHKGRAASILTCGEINPGDDMQPGHRSILVQKRANRPPAPSRGGWQIHYCLPLTRFFCLPVLTCRTYHISPVTGAVRGTGKGGTVGRKRTHGARSLRRVVYQYVGLMSHRQSSTGDSGGRRAEWWGTVAHRSKRPQRWLGVPAQYSPGFH